MSRINNHAVPIKDRTEGKFGRKKIIVHVRLFGTREYTKHSESMAIFKPTSFSLGPFGHNLPLQDFKLISKNQLHEKVEVITI